ncbi:MAG: PAS domain S-box protein, partial [Gemmatimonadota bacterium]|nr:PAS domain S-box protein [Gemmatimonadota bacterium]
YWRMHKPHHGADYRTMVESAPEAIIVYADGRFLYVNSFAAHRLKADQGALVSEPIMGFVHPESVEAVTTRLRQLEETGEAGPPFEVRFVARDGTVIQSEVVSVLITFEGQKAVLTLIRDISRRVDVERALRESEERFGNAFEKSPHGMAFVSPDGHWLRANAALCAMVGYTQEELRARTFKEISHPDDVPDDLEQVRAMIRGKQDSYNKVKRYYAKDGRVIWVCVDVFAVRNQEGAVLYFIGQVQDITRQRALEAEAAHGRWLAGIGETTVAIAHQMNNALTILMMNAELLAAGEAKGEEVRSLAAEVMVAAKRIEAIVEGLSRLGDPKSIDYVGEKKMLDLSSLGLHDRT